jgi:hypothetical protein
LVAGLRFELSAKAYETSLGTSLTRNVLILLSKSFGQGPRNRTESTWFQATDATTTPDPENQKAEPFGSALFPANT